MTNPEDENAQRGIAALEYQNRILLAQVEALRAALATRDDEIAHLTGQLLEQKAHAVAPLSLLARLLKWRP